jgi:hypothetical protein
MGTDDYLTVDVPRIRRAQQRTYQAIEFSLDMIECQRTDVYHIQPRPGQHEIRLADVNPTRLKARRSPTHLRPFGLHLATAGVHVDTLLTIAGSRTVRYKHPGLSRRATRICQTMGQDLNAVCTKLRTTIAPLYGDDDPLTAAWLLPVADAGTRLATLLGRNLAAGLQRAARRAQLITSGPKGTGRQSLDANISPNHGWPILCVLAARRVSPEIEVDLYDWAIREIEEQLSIQLSGQNACDPAHLACCLAIALKLRPMALSLPTIERAINMICGNQLANGSWVIERPFIINHRGQTSRPIAAELTLGAVAVVEELDHTFPEHPIAARLEYTLLDALQRQREWFFATAVSPVSGQAQPERLAWHSEYVQLREGRLHTWATARVTTALTRLLDIENRLATRRLITESGFTAQPGDKFRSFEKLTDPDQGNRASSFQSLERYVKSTENASSAVLYGPPGTSKTSLAQALAKELGWTFVSLSPSDFLLGGADAIENRAKRIFDYLVQLHEVVVLFDEIDRLLLDRDSDAYGDQTDVFKFMTPSMLPKLAALHDTRGLKFIVATNYGEQLDPAVTRPDRIDDILMVSAPNLEARKKILRAQTKVGSSRREAVAKATPLWVFGELKRLSDRNSVREIINRRPVIRLADYTQRLQARFRGIGLVARECLVLGGVIAEVKRPFSQDERDALTLAFEKGDPSLMVEFDTIARALKPTKPRG